MLLGAAIALPVSLVFALGAGIVPAGCGVGKAMFLTSAYLAAIGNSHVNKIEY